MSSSEGTQLFRLVDGLDGVPQRVEPGTFAAIGALELQHIERWLKARPDLLGEELAVIASQFSGFDRTRDRPDLLALDRRGRLVVIEIKRDDSGSGQDLQAIRYAAYVSTFTSQEVARLYCAYRLTQHGENLTEPEAKARLEEFAGVDDLDVVDADPTPRIVLVARAFQPGVTATALWLRRNFGMDISCVQLTPYQVDESLLLSSSVLIPLPEASEYEVRMEEKRRRSTHTRGGDTIDFTAALAFVASIPAGRWSSYGDVAAAAGAPRGAQAIGTWLLQTEQEVPHVWRVLRRTGEVSEGWRAKEPSIPATPEAVRERLKAEGVEFDAVGRASPAQRWTPEDMAEAEKGSA